MNLNNKLIIQILEFLSTVFPNYVFVAQVLPEHKDSHEIDKYLVYCKGRGWIELDEKRTATGSVILGQVRITSQGIDYLLEMSR